jgi:single-stranded-DNA-specific exonuclease
MTLADMRPAVDRLFSAIARRERIAIHGDYDVDGVT